MITQLVCWVWWMAPNPKSGKEVISYHQSHSTFVWYKGKSVILSAHNYLLYMTKISATPMPMRVLSNPTEPIQCHVKTNTNDVST